MNSVYFSFFLKEIFLFTFYCSKKNERNIKYRKIRNIFIKFDHKFKQNINFLKQRLLRDADVVPEKFPPAKLDDNNFTQFLFTKF